MNQPNDGFSAGFAAGSLTGGDVLVQDSVYSTAPVLNFATVPSRVDVTLAPVLRSRVVLGVGGYYAPRS